MPTKQTVRAALVCHKGCVRSNNEDNFFFNGNYMPLRSMNQGAVMVHEFPDKCQLYGVFDGMGGGDMGECASALAASRIQDVYLSMQSGAAQKLLEDYAQAANERIAREAHSQHAGTMGTTMAVVLLRGNECHVGNVGDSRVYLLRDHQLQQLSTDHSIVGEMVRDGRMTPEQARKSSKNNVITRFLGMAEDEKPAVLVEYRQLELRSGDRLMLCSDGLCDLLSAAALEETLSTVAAPEDCAKQLVLSALELGGKDNTTCIVVDMGAFCAAAPAPREQRVPVASAADARRKEAAVADQDEDTSLL